MEPLAWYQIAAPVVACLVVDVFAAVGHTRFRFAALGITAGVGYGILQDQVSARLCPEYFTVFHPPVPGLIDPTLLGMTWGFLGTWWAGLLLGYIAGLIATLGSLPEFTPREAIRPVLILVASIAVAVMVTGVTVWRHVEMFGVSIDPELGKMLPPQRHRALLVVACYHFVGYAVAFGGSVALWAWIWRERIKRALLIRPEPYPQNTPQQADTA